MPIYEFACQECQKTFEQLVLSASAVGQVTCPSCGSPQVRKKMSTFASKPAGGASLSLGSSSSCAPGSV